MESHRLIKCKGNCGSDIYSTNSHCNTCLFPIMMQKFADKVKPFMDEIEKLKKENAALKLLLSENNIEVPGVDGTGKKAITVKRNNTAVSKTPSTIIVAVKTCSEEGCDKPVTTYNKNRILENKCDLHLQGVFCLAKIDGKKCSKVRYDHKGVPTLCCKECFEILSKTRKFYNCDMEGCDTPVFNFTGHIHFCQRHVPKKKCGWKEGCEEQIIANDMQTGRPYKHCSAHAKEKREKKKKPQGTKNENLQGTTKKVTFKCNVCGNNLRNTKYPMCGDCYKKNKGETIKEKEIGAIKNN